MSEKSKFTVVDKIIIFVIAVGILAGAVALAMNFLNSSAKDKKEEIENNGDAEFVVLVQGVEAGTGSIINIGDEILISGEDVYAKITAVEETPRKVYEFSKAKEAYIIREEEGRADIKVTLKCEAKITNNKITCGELDMRVGNPLTVHGKGYNIWGYIIGLEDKLWEDK